MELDRPVWAPVGKDPLCKAGRSWCGTHCHKAYTPVAQWFGNCQAPAPKPASHGRLFGSFCPPVTVGSFLPFIVSTLSCISYQQEQGCSYTIKGLTSLRPSWRHGVRTAVMRGLMTQDFFFFFLFKIFFFFFKIFILSSNKKVRLGKKRPFRVMARQG